MGKIFDFIAGDEWLLMITMILSLYVAIVVFFMTFIKSRRHHQKSKWNEAYLMIINGIKQGTLDNDNDILLIYNKIINENNHDYSYIDFLESLLLYTRKTYEDKETIIQISCRINPILLKEREEKPYSNINDRERRILLTIEEAAKKNEPNSIKNTLLDLSMVIESNQKALDRARRTNKWTVPISIIGVVLTLFIWWYGTSLSNKDIERISNKIYTTIIDNLHITSNDTMVIINRNPE